MRGVYTRVLCNTTPSIAEVAAWFRVPGEAARVPGAPPAPPTELYVCRHDDIRGGVLVEVASAGWPVVGQSWGVTSLEFFADAIVEAGGVCLYDGAVAAHPPARLGARARAALGFVTHVHDAVDVSHPHAFHAADECATFLRAEK